MRVATTCIQLIRDLEQWRHAFDAAGLDVTVPTIPGQHLEGDALVAALSGCVGVVAGDDRFTGDVLDRLPELRVISKWGVGVDGIDLVAARDRGIVVRNTPGMFNDEVADVTMAYITMLARELVQVDRRVREGVWYKPPGRSLRGSTLGIVGLGGIGRATAARAIVAGMQVIGCDPSPESATAASALGVESVTFDTLLDRSEFIALTCPLTAATFHLFDDRVFESVRQGVRLVNTGRGAVLDNDALVRAVHRGRVHSAALDVMEAEPVAPHSALASIDQIVLGSHNASNTIEASARVHEHAIANLVEELVR